MADKLTPADILLLEQELTLIRVQVRAEGRKLRGAGAYREYTDVLTSIGHVELHPDGAVMRHRHRITRISLTPRKRRVPPKPLAHTAHPPKMRDE